MPGPPDCIFKHFIQPNSCPEVPIMSLIELVCWVLTKKKRKFIFAASKPWMPGPQNCISQLLLEPEGCPEGANPNSNQLGYSSGIWVVGSKFHSPSPSSLEVRGQPLSGIERFSCICCIEKNNSSLIPPHVRPKKQGKKVCKVLYCVKDSESVTRKPNRRISFILTPRDKFI